MAATTRTDIHRPSADEFDPQDYDLVAVFDLDPDEGDNDRRTRIVAGLLAKGHALAGVHPLGQCEHCGARLRYAALLIHVPTGQLIFVGETCLEGRFAALTKTEFARLRRQAAQRRQDKVLPERARELIAQFPELAELAEPGSEIVAGSDFLASIGEQFRRNGRLSERQTDAARRVIADRRRWQAERTRRETERVAAEVARPVLAPVPTGRVTVTGVVREAKWVDDPNIPSGGYPVMVVTAQGELAGYTIRVTLPRALRPSVIEVGWLRAVEGRRVSVDVGELRTGKVTGYLFGSRPTKARYLD